MGISRDKAHKRRATGGRKKSYTKKKKIRIGTSTKSIFVLKLTEKTDLHSEWVYHVTKPTNDVLRVVVKKRSEKKKIRIGTSTVDDQNRRQKSDPNPRQGRKF